MSFWFRTFQAARNFIAFHSAKAMIWKSHICKSRTSDKALGATFQRRWGFVCGSWTGLCLKQWDHGYKRIQADKFVGTHPQSCCMLHETRLMVPCKGVHLGTALLRHCPYQHFSDLKRPRVVRFMQSRQVCVLTVLLCLSWMQHFCRKHCQVAYLVHISTQTFCVLMCRNARITFHCRTHWTKT